MDSGVLADLELGEVEPERPDLPAELGHLSPRHAIEAVGHQRLADLDELGVQVGDRRVSAAQGCRLADERSARAAQPLGDEPEALPVWLVGEPAAKQAVRLGEVLGVAGETRGERPRDPVASGHGRDGLHQPCRHRLVAVENMVGVDAERSQGDVGGHLGVAVPVAADPASRPQERADARRARPGPAAVGGGPAGTAGRAVQGAVQRAIQPGHHREQRRVEEGHRGPDLVERRRRHDAQVGGAPEEGDLLAQSTTDLAILRRGQPRIVQPLEEVGAASQRQKGRPPAGFGRMRRQHRGDRQPAHEGVELGVRAAEPSQAGHRVGDRIVEDPVPRGALAPAQRPHPATRLGEIDEAEIQRECADHRLGGIEIERPKLLVESRSLERIVVTPEGDGAPADALDRREQLGAFLLRDDLSEERAEQTDLHRERIAGAAGADPERLRRDSRRRAVGTGRRPSCGRGWLRDLRSRLVRAHRGPATEPFRARAATRPQPFAPQPFHRLVS